MAWPCWVSFVVDPAVTQAEHILSFCFSYITHSQSKIVTNKVFFSFCYSLFHLTFSSAFIVLYSLTHRIRSACTHEHISDLLAKTTLFTLSQSTLSDYWLTLHAHRQRHLTNTQVLHRNTSQTLKYALPSRRMLHAEGGKRLHHFPHALSTYSVEPLPSMNRYNQVRNPNRMLTVHSTTEHGYTSLTQSNRQNYYTSNEHQNKLTTRNDSLFFTGWKDKNITAFTITSPWKDSRHHKNTAYWRTRGQNWKK